MIYKQYVTYVLEFSETDRILQLANNSSYLSSILYKNYMEMKEGIDHEVNDLWLPQKSMESWIETKT